MTQERAHVDRFFDLHNSAEMLVLPNAWDAASAKIVQRAGAKAIATTSGGVAQSLGYPDGNALCRKLAVDAVARIVRVVDLPVSVDIEEGYGDTPKEVCLTVEQILEAGAVGINLEDGASPPTLLAEKIEAIRKRSEQLGVSVFINARTDVYLLGLDSPEDETLKRAQVYQDAGADGLFVPGLAEPDSIKRICIDSSLPVNVMVLPGIARPDGLSALGVKRLSVGAGIMQSALGFTERCAKALLTAGDYEFFDGAISNADVNAMFRK